MPACDSFQVAVPMLARVLEYAVMLSVVWTFTGLFPFIHSLTRGGPGYETTTLDYMIYIKSFVSGVNLGEACAIAVLLLLIILALVQARQSTLAVLAVLASVLTLWYYLIFHRKAFFGKLDERWKDVKEAPFWMSAATVLLALIAIGVGIGLGLQSMAANLIAGFIIIFGGKVRKGDWIQVENGMGVVTDIHLVSTRVRTRGNVEYLIPNSTLVSNTIVNYTLSSPLVWTSLSVGVSYDSDPQQVKRILLENRLWFDPRTNTPLYLERTRIGLKDYRQWFRFTAEGVFRLQQEPASAIAACGLLELARWLPDRAQAARYQAAAEQMTQSLYEIYSTRNDPRSNALILHGVYGKPLGHGVDEANLWGDYFYLEALMRLSRPEWEIYW